MSLQDYRSLEKTSERSPEDLQEGLAVGDSLVVGHKRVAIDGHGVALHAEVASKLHIEAHLMPAITHEVPTLQEQQFMTTYSQSVACVCALKYPYSSTTKRTWHHIPESNLTPDAGSINNKCLCHPRLKQRFASLPAKSTAILVIK